MANLHTPYFNSNESGEDAKRQYIEFRFDCLVKVKELKLQGFENFKIAINVSGNDGPLEVIETLEGAVTKFELWYGAGDEYRSVKNGDSSKKWQKVSALGHDIKEFETHATSNDYDAIKTVNDFRPFHADTVRLYFKEFIGNVLASKFAIIIDDPNGVVCPQKCDHETVNIGGITQQKSCPKPSPYYW